MHEVVIYGTGGFARETHELVADWSEGAYTDQEGSGGLRILGFLDDDATRFGHLVHDLPVLGGVEWAEQHPGVGVVLGIGSPVTKRQLAKRLRATRATFPSFIHEAARKGRFVRIGQGCLIGAGSILTTDIVLGDFVTVNLAVTIGHDSRIGSFTTINPGAQISGNVTLGEGCDVGTGSVFIQSVTVGDWSIIGAGASVVSDLPANITAVGVPAKEIKRRDAGWHR